MVILDAHPHVELSGPMPGFSQFELRRIRHSLFFLSVASCAREKWTSKKTPYDTENEGDT